MFCIGIAGKTVCIISNGLAQTVGDIDLGKNKENKNGTVL